MKRSREGDPDDPPPAPYWAPADVTWVDEGGLGSVCATGRRALVEMRPIQYLRATGFAGTLPVDRRQGIGARAAEGVPITRPSLLIGITDGGDYKVINHEGRHRAMMLGPVRSSPVPVNVFFSRMSEDEEIVALDRVRHGPIYSQAGDLRAKGLLVHSTFGN